MKSETMKVVPTGMPAWRWRYWAMMSVPPVLPPPRMTRPMPAPQTAPPQIEARSRSLVISGTRGSIRSIMTPEQRKPAMTRSR